MNPSDFMQIDQAARGAISNTLEEWPMLRGALNRHGLYLHPSTDSWTLTTICKMILESIPRPVVPTQQQVISEVTKTAQAMKETSRRITYYSGLNQSTIGKDLLRLATELDSLAAQMTPLQHGQEP